MPTREHIPPTGLAELEHTAAQRPEWWAILFGLFVEVAADKPIEPIPYIPPGGRPRRASRSIPGYLKGRKPGVSREAFQRTIKHDPSAPRPGVVHPRKPKRWDEEIE